MRRRAEHVRRASLAARCAGDRFPGLISFVALSFLRSRHTRLDRVRVPRRFRALAALLALTTRDFTCSRRLELTSLLCALLPCLSIQVDGPLATVWARYDFYLNGTFSHCGHDAFMLALTPAASGGESCSSS